MGLHLLPLPFCLRLLLLPCCLRLLPVSRRFRCHMYLLFRAAVRFANVGTVPGLRCCLRLLSVAAAAVGARELLRFSKKNETLPSFFQEI
ncbi:hypothetical protein MmiEs2_07000 [Methanimicrococcus stummii]|uniref:Uncharacterized protein n=1 Tax=Methanimicrococcus stummii TaxID=3028294 RepID=A0AA96V9S4_9EURY|nr:hypothetical protein MmiEs2_07000 [Methanimicrococcus sp. Es2]